jgi:hypothetical protein
MGAAANAQPPIDKRDRPPGAPDTPSVSTATRIGLLPGAPAGLPAAREEAMSVASRLVLKPRAAPIRM